MTTSAAATAKRYKFQNLEVYQLALQYLDSLYELSKKFPSEEKYNLTSQLQRAGTSIVLNISEGSTGQSDLEQNRFLGLALRSYLETVACLDIAQRRMYLSVTELAQTGEFGHRLFIKLQSFRRSLKGC
jgi:four helix bundle protein